MRVRLIVIEKSFSINNIYAKSVRKEYSTSHKLHPITSARVVGGALNAPPTESGAELRKF